MTTREFIALLVLFLPLIALIILGLWKIDERVLRLEALVKCLESELIAFRKKSALKDGDAK